MTEGRGDQDFPINRALRHFSVWLRIVGLDVALKGPFFLVGESKLSRESEMSRTK